MTINPAVAIAPSQTAPAKHCGDTCKIPEAAHHPRTQTALVACQWPTQPSQVGWMPQQRRWMQSKPKNQNKTAPLDTRGSHISLSCVLKVFCRPHRKCEPLRCLCVSSVRRREESTRPKTSTPQINVRKEKCMQRRELQEIFCIVTRNHVTACCILCLHVQCP
jgi:hypothetical protein